MYRLGILAAVAFLVGACTATPITLPGTEDGGPWTGLDAGSYDAAAADVMPPSFDVDLLHPDAVSGGDAGVGDGAVADALSDGVCLECPLSDGMTDGGAGDAEAGLTSDALTDLPGGDLTSSD